MRTTQLSLLALDLHCTTEIVKDPQTFDVKYKLEQVQRSLDSQMSLLQLTTMRFTNHRDNFNSFPRWWLWV
jgi:hypothetical protein